MPDTLRAISMTSSRYSVSSPLLFRRSASSAASTSCSASTVPRSRNVNAAAGDTAIDSMEKSVFSRMSRSGVATFNRSCIAAGMSPCRIRGRKSWLAATRSVASWQHREASFVSPSDTDRRMSCERPSSPPLARKLSWASRRFRTVDATAVSPLLASAPSALLSMDTRRPIARGCCRSSSPWKVGLFDAAVAITAAAPMRRGRTSDRSRTTGASPPMVVRSFALSIGSHRICIPSSAFSTVWMAAAWSSLRASEAAWDPASKSSASSAQFSK
mmetsp:Transcript_328/g.871  ORF Transcript_328/g.871 Transcript_328/m.871 type:complete len:272 (-) Transcript_328:560-1375(-)